MFDLGDLPGGAVYGRAYGASADGSIIIGGSESGLGREAFIWDETNGMQSIKDVLVNNYGLDLTGWYLGRASGISADGRTIVGEGIGPNGSEAWIATIPEPTTLCLLTLGGLVLRKRIQ